MDHCTAQHSTAQCIIKTVVWRHPDANTDKLAPQTLPSMLLPALLVPVRLICAAMMSSNEALKYVSFPTQVLAKSCKMVPVMVIKVLRFGEQYKFRDYFVVLLVTMGIITFRWNSSSSSSSASSEDGTVESKEHEANSAYGLGLLLLSLACDGMTGTDACVCK